jgi:hypothetical protein
MVKNKAPHTLYWQALADQQIRNEYEAYLRTEGCEKNAHSAQLFATRKIHNGYREKSERDLILLLVGELPYMYD